MPFIATIRQPHKSNTLSISRLKEKITMIIWFLICPCQQVSYISSTALLMRIIAGSPLSGRKSRAELNSSMFCFWLMIHPLGATVVEYQWRICDMNALEFTCPVLLKHKNIVSTNPHFTKKKTNPFLPPI